MENSPFGFGRCPFLVKTGPHWISLRVAAFGRFHGVRFALNGFHVRLTSHCTQPMGRTQCKTGAKFDVRNDNRIIQGV